MQDGFAETEEQTQIYICDINPNMLNVGKKRAIERGLLLRYVIWACFMSLFVATFVNNEFSFLM